METGHMLHVDFDRFAVAILEDREGRPERPRPIEDPTLETLVGEDIFGWDVVVRNGALIKGGGHVAALAPADDDPAHGEASTSRRFE